MKSASDQRAPPRLRLPLKTWDPLKGVVNTNGDALLLEKQILLILSPFSKLHHSYSLQLVKEELPHPSLASMMPHLIDHRDWSNSWTYDPRQASPNPSLQFSRPDLRNKYPMIDRTADAPIAIQPQIIFLNRWWSSRPSFH